MTTAEEALSFARRLHEAPYEVFSRFLLDDPRHLYGDEAQRHLEQGWGLSCSEKARLMAHWLEQRGVPNAILGGGFEMIVGGVNLLKIKGSAREPPNEAFIARFFAPDWKTSPYETAIHLAHWANVFELDGESFLVDTLGCMSSFRAFRGDEVRRLLDLRPKQWVPYLPTRQRLYYHRLSPHLLGLIEAKHRGDREYVLGKFLGTALAATERAYVNAKWWWKERAFEEEAARYPELLRQVSSGEMEIAMCSTVDELRDHLPEQSAPHHEALGRAWPVMRAWLDRVFERPAIVRLVVSKARRPLAEYAPHQVLPT